jgi:hypothetical protein
MEVRALRYRGLGRVDMLIGEDDEEEICQECWGRKVWK